MKKELIIIITGIEMKIHSRGNTNQIQDIKVKLSSLQKELTDLGALDFQKMLSGVGLAPSSPKKPKKDKKKEGNKKSKKKRLHHSESKPKSRGGFFKGLKFY